MVPQMKKTSPKGLFNLPAAADSAGRFIEKSVFIHVISLPKKETAIFGSMP
jgi:hypothetical protein